jgi:hypothetical protein
MSDNYSKMSIPPLPKSDTPFRVPLYGGIVPSVPTTVTGIKTEKLGIPIRFKCKASLLYILTGLGKYSWYTLPFIKGIICVSLPALMMFEISLFLKRYLKIYTYGCLCDQHRCKYLVVFGLSIGLCKAGKEKYKRRQR